MKTLTLALYAEGRTDERFLPELIEHIVIDLLCQHGANDISVNSIIVLPGNEIRADASQIQRIVNAARLANGYHALIVHADADAPDRDKALQERFYPGRKIITQYLHETCQELIPLIPVRMIEAWMLVDAEALCTILPGCKDAATLELFKDPKQVEHILNPKQELQHIIKKVTGHRRQPNITEIQTSLAEEINLALLRKVPAYQEFEHDLEITLRKLHFIA